MVLRRVGILGGMGPEATVLLMQKVIAAVPASCDDDHIPLLVDQNPQVPSRLHRLIEKVGEDPAPVLADMACRLQKAGAEALAIPCNTAHYFLPEIRSAVSVPFIDMVQLSVMRAQKLVVKNRKVGILASPAVRMIQLFEPAFAAAGLEPVYLDDDAVLLSLIKSIKAKGVSDDARSALFRASQSLLQQGATVQMIGCTEFSLISNAVTREATAFDALDCLVNGIVKFSKSTSNNAN